MADDVKQRMIRSAVYLLSRDGYQGASFSAVLEHSGAPRGSIYHHFPGGKDELVAAAIEATLDRGLGQLEPYRGKTLPTVLRGMSRYWRDVLEHSDCACACPIIATSVGANAPDLQRVIGAVLVRWRTRYRDVLEESGVPHRRSGDLAALLLSGYEGAMHLARAERSITVFDDAVRALHRSVTALVSS